MHCEYDGQVLPTDPETGLADACPACSADIEEHNRECSDCRRAPYLPTHPSVKGLLPRD